MHAEESERLFREESEVKWCPLEGSKIVEFYKGKNVFVTGATGFLGKLLVEKLLRACPDIDNLYILMRPKRAEDEFSRIDKLCSAKIFTPLAKLYPKFQHKITIIKGDLSLPDLGFSHEDKQKLIEEVNVIFHIGATVKFDEKINLAAFTNVRSTRDLLKIAKECKQLQSFVHVSTAYAFWNSIKLEEVFYKPPMTADELIELVKDVPEKVLLKNTSKIIRDWPNTYTFTKATAESAVKDYASDLPVCIVRPSIVIATYKEPLRSWIDNLYGATGVIVAAGTGLLKTLHCDKNNSADLVPGDYVINCMIAASYRTAVANDRTRVPIYNYVCSVENHYTWKDLMKHCSTWGEEVPTIRCVWYHSLTLNKYYLIHMIYTVFLHFLPAFFMDLWMILQGQAPIMTKIYKKVHKFVSVIAYFSVRDWKYCNDNTQALWKCTSEVDRKLFPFSMKELDWNEYHKTHLVGLRVYLVQDDLSTLPQARKRWRKFYIANIVVKIAFYCGILAILYFVFKKILNFFGNTV